jgi:HK97 family phage major capsid protein
VLDDIVAEYKSLAVQPDTAGGYLAPRELVHEIIKAEVLVSPFRPLVRVRQTAMKAVKSRSAPAPSPPWVAEQGTKSETTGLAYGLKEIPTNELYALVDISNQMLEDSAFDMQAEISMEAVRAVRCRRRRRLRLRQRGRQAGRHPDQRGRVGARSPARPPPSRTPTARPTACSP